MQVELPEVFETEEYQRFDEAARKFIEPTNRRARRSFDEDLAFFHDRMESWISCKGSNHDFAYIESDHKKTILGISKAIQWFRVTLAQYLIEQVAENKSNYIPHDYRGKMAAIKDYILELHNEGKIKLTARDLKRHGIEVSKLTRDLG